jgi:diguanylate cyclase (GGDEF)-like protein/putative nucleotidyltransferase with HDIG domain
VSGSEHKADILVVDDEAGVRRMICESLSIGLHRCTEAEDATQAYDLVCRKHFDVLISDMAMPGMTGLELLDKVVAVQPECRVILITGVGSSEWAKESIKRGAFDYLEKPFNLQDLRQVVTEALKGRVAAGSVGPDKGRERRPEAVARVDGLTGLLTHRSFFDELTRLRALCRRHSHPLAVAVIDVDVFGELNLRHGHGIGDLVLREIGSKLRRVVRDSDVLARFGGDEFALAMPETTADQARVMADRVRGVLRDLPMSLPSDAGTPTVSIGLAESQSGFIESESDLVSRALQAVQAGKRQGRDQIMVWEEIAQQDAPPLEVDEGSLEQMRERFSHIHQQLKQAYLESTRALVAAVEAKEPYTERHSMAVALYAEGIARVMGLTGAQIASIRTAAMLHDVGKIGIPDSILNKPGPLTEGEYALVKRHTVMAAQILEHTSFLRSELPIIVHHHEWWDGSGYPEGLAGEAIPLGARILHVADAMDAMFSVRSYKQSFGLERVIAELRQESARQFDPIVAEAAIAWLERNPDQIVQSGAQPSLVTAES